MNESEVLLWIEDGKTEAATRFMEVPEPLAGILSKRVGLGKPEDWLFPAPSRTGHRGATWLRKVVKKLCQETEVPTVCPHGLRGTWATLTTAAGVSGHIVARELGHTTPTTTRKHYTKAGADEQARSRQMMRIIKVKDEDDEEEE